MIHINIAYYRKEDWDRFLQMVDDREELHDSWEEWHQVYKNTKKNLEKSGLKPIDFIVNLDDLRRYCLENRLKNIGSTRAKFVQKK